LIFSTPINGTLVRSTDIGGTVYAIYGGAKFGNTDTEQLAKVGYKIMIIGGIKIDDAQHLQQWQLDRLPDQVPQNGTLMQQKSEDGTTTVGAVYVIYGGAKFGITSPEQFAASGFNSVNVIGVPQWVLDRLPDQVPQNGTLMQQPGVGAVYVTYGGAKFGIVSEDQFNNSGFDWYNIIPVSDWVLDRLPDQVPQNGTLMQRNDPTSGAIYVTYGGAKFGITSPEQFAASGFNSVNVIGVPQWVLDRLPDQVPQNGTLMQQKSDDGTTTVGAVYVIYGGAKFGIHNPDEFTRLQLDSNKVIPVPGWVLERMNGIPVDGTLLKELDTLAIYYIVNGKKRLIPNQEIFNAHGWTNNSYGTVPPGYLEAIPNGLDYA